jgi:hypothetical protein
MPKSRPRFMDTKPAEQSWTDRVIPLVVCEP